MKDAIQAEIDALKAEFEKVKAEYEAKIAAKEQVLKDFIEAIPAELHGLEVSIWNRIAGFFSSHDTPVS